jgi:oxygen-independent coproporphyrinogen-3 oxidase
LQKLLGGLRQAFDLSSVTEATMEANPESVTAELLQAARAAGLNRISIGVQSLSDAELQSVGRVHNASQAVLALEAALRIGFSNVSADVIIGLPGQDWSSLMITLETLIGLGVRHLSVYCLALEPHTPLAANPPADLPSEDAQAELYENVCALLAERGLVHYEISNFALPGFECRHNLNYWRGGEYLGLGPAAASHLQNKRFKNKADLEAYLQNPTGQIEGMEDLPAAEKAAEEAVLRLRLLEEGLRMYDMAEKFGDEHILELVSRLDQLAKESLLLRSGGVYRLEPSRALVSNAILTRVL